MAIDRIGNSLRRATDVDLNGSAAIFRDQVSQRDRRDMFRLNLSRGATVQLNLKGGRGKLQLKLLDAAGNQLRSRRPKGTTANITQPLESGTYYVQVSPNRGRTSRYRLTVGNTAPASGFNIRFDYRYDTSGWFTPERRNALETAARIWENIILDDLPDVAAGTSVRALTNPATGALIRDFADDAAIDDVVIFVAGRELGGTTLGLTSMPIPFSNQTRLTGNPFQPWLGTIAFDTNTNWFFDPTPETTNDIPGRSSDFISTAVHEMAHVFGFGTSDAYDGFVEQSAFRGGNAIAVNGGQPIPLRGLAHFDDDYQFGGSGIALMTPFALTGKRKLPTRLDVAVLDDIGYTINYGATAQNPTA
jgi:hypothetical protein